jgi:two-component system, LytTR family, sensor histidine kinase AlgZ
MHPLVTPIKRLGLYWVAWIPLTAILVYLMASPGRLGWWEAAAVVVPLCAVYQFVCLSAWYSCRSAPIQKSTMQRLSLTHVTAAVVLSLLWVQTGKLLAYALSRTSSFLGLDQRFASQVPVLFGAGFLLYLLAVAFHYVILALEDSRKAETRAMETSILARDAELKALKAQVNPHFLFNSLNSISALTSIDPAKAREMCILLADFLRMTLGMGEKNAIPLAEEISLLHRFLAIEKVRFGSRLRMTEDIAEECKSLLIPPLLLQPLVENAVTHGIANLPEGGCIRLAAHCHEGLLTIVVENTFDPESTLNRRNGMGLENVRQRLEARYPRLASMRVSPEHDKFQVTLSFPAEAQEVAR